MRDSVACSMVLSCEALAFDITAFIVNMIYYINIYIIFCYIACFVPCIVCWCSMVCTVSATSEQQGKARQGVYMVVIHRLLINLWISLLRLILVVDKLLVGCG